MSAADVARARLFVRRVSEKQLPANLSELLKGQCLRSIERRGKYLIWSFDRGYIVSHLGMSGVMRVVDPKATEPVKHDHIDILFGDLAVRYHDPRRFGFLIWLPESQDPHDLPEIAKLGEEPFRMALLRTGCIPL